MRRMTRGDGRGGVLLILLLTGAAGCSKAGETSSGSAGAATANAGSSATSSGGNAGGASGGAAAGAGDDGNAGSSTAGEGGSATGVAGSAGTGGGAALGGASNCAGKAVSFSHNASGEDPDDAKAQVVIDMMTDLPIGNAHRTIEFWADIKPTDWIGGHNELFMYGDVSAKSKVGAFGLDFGDFPVDGMPDNHATLNPFTAGGPFDGFGEESRNYLGITSSVRQWVHIAMSWDGIAIKIYVNGALKITSAGKGGATALATEDFDFFSLGCNPERQGYFNGNFDELRIWSTARSDAEIAANYDTSVATDAPGLVGYWKFDEEDTNGNSPDAVTTPGHEPHPAASTASEAFKDRPTIITPTPPPPIRCR